MSYTDRVLEAFGNDRLASAQFNYSSSVGLYPHIQVWNNTPNLVISILECWVSSSSDLSVLWGFYNTQLSGSEGTGWLVNSMSQAQGMIRSQDLATPNGNGVNTGRMGVGFQSPQRFFPYFLQLKQNQGFIITTNLSQSGLEGAIVWEEKVIA